MRAPRVLFTSLLALAVASLGLLAPTAGAAPGRPRIIASGFFLEGAKPINVNGTYTPIVGKFATNSSRSDVIWYAPGPGAEQVWANTADEGFAKSALGQQVDGNYVPLAGNFSGSPYDDIFWYGAGANADLFWKNVSSSTFDASGITVSGAYYPFTLNDSLGYDDILWWKPGGASSVWSFTGTGTAHVAHNFTAPAGTPLRGDFNADGYADIFWYQAGTGADSLWLGNGNGVFTKHPQTVNGTFTPLVADFTPFRGGERDDILWYRAPGTSVLWESNGDGTWATSPHTLPAGTPVASTGSGWGVVYVIRQGLPDQVWFKNTDIEAVRAAGAGAATNGQGHGARAATDYLQDAGNTEIGTGYTPLVANWEDTIADIFWYKPGSGAEHLFYSSSAK